MVIKTVIVKADGSERDIEILFVRSALNEDEAISVSRLFANGSETHDPVEATEVEIEGVRVEVQAGDRITVRVDIN